MHLTIVERVEQRENASRFIGYEGLTRISIRSIATRLHGLAPRERIDALQVRLCGCVPVCNCATLLRTERDDR